MRLQNLISKISRKFKKTTTKTIQSLQSHDTSSFSIFNGFFSFTFGSRNKRIFIQEGYGNNPIVYPIIDKIAKVTSSLPTEVTTNNAIVRDLIENPNDKQTQQEFDHELISYLEASGDAFLILTNGVGGFGAEWRLAQSYNVEIISNRLGEIVRYDERKHGATLHHEAENVLHIKFTNIVSDSSISDDNQFYGLSPLQAAWKTVSASNENFEAEAAIFKNRGVIGFLSNDSDAPMLPKTSKALQEHITSEIGGAEKFNSIYVTNQKVRFIQTSMSPEDLKLIESQINNLRTLCNVYGLDSSLFNDPANKTFSNRKDAQIAAYTDTYLPLGKHIADKKARYLSKRFATPVEIAINRDEIEVLQANDIVPEPTEPNND